MKLILERLGNFGRYQAFLYVLCFVPGFMGGASTLVYQWTGFMPTDHRQYLGNFGRYQAFIYTLCFLTSFLGGTMAFAYYWVGFIPTEHRCRLPDEPANSTYEWATENKQVFRYDTHNQCRYCNKEAMHNDTYGHGRCGESGSTFCSGTTVVWRESTALVPNSIAVRHRLFCADVWKHRLVWSLNTVGFGIGAAVFGTLSDKFGRRRIFLLCAFLFIIVMHIIPFASGYILYCALQVLVGCINYGCYLTMYIIFMEFVDGMPRTLCGVWYQGMFTCGMLWDGFVAYAITSDWQLLQWLAGAPTLILISYYWLVPESVRWSLVHGRVEEARRTVRRAAKCNGVTVPDEVLDAELEEIEKHRAHAENNKNSAGLLDLFRHWRLAKNTIIMFYSWFATSMGFYGLSQNTSDLPGSPYLTYTLGALVEFPGYLIAVPLMEYWGRRPTSVALFGVGGVACILAGVIRNATVTLVMALIGKMCVAAAFAVVYNYAAELFPTVVRQTGCGWASVCARVGSLLAPQIRLLGDYAHPSLPIIIYGAISGLAAILALFLPETRNMQLPETIDDGVYFGVERPDETPELEAKNLADNGVHQQLLNNSIKK